MFNVDITKAVFREGLLSAQQNDPLFSQVLQVDERRHQKQFKNKVRKLLLHCCKLRLSGIFKILIINLELINLFVFFIQNLFILSHVSAVCPPELPNTVSSESCLDVCVPW